MSIFNIQIWNALPAKRQTGLCHLAAPLPWRHELVIHLSAK